MKTLSNVLSTKSEAQITLASFAKPSQDNVVPVSTVYLDDRSMIFHLQRSMKPAMASRCEKSSFPSLIANYQVGFYGCL